MGYADIRVDIRVDTRVDIGYLYKYIYQIICHGVMLCGGGGVFVMLTYVLSVAKTNSILA